MNQRDKTKAFYNKIAEQTFNDWFNNPALLPTLTKFLNYLPKNPLILDLGCGTGGESKRLKNLGARVIGIDFSEESIKFARKNVPDVEFIVCDIINIKFPKGHFDGVVEAGVLFHFTKEEQDLILQKIITMLKPTGLFLSYYPEGSYEGMQKMNTLSEICKRYSRQLPIKSWVDQVLTIGFKSNKEYKLDIGTFKCVLFGKERALRKTKG